VKALLADMKNQRNNRSHPRIDNVQSETLLRLWQCPDSPISADNAPAGRL
jgi:hypothetical protein